MPEEEFRTKLLEMLGDDGMPLEFDTGRISRSVALLLYLGMLRNFQPSKDLMLAMMPQTVEDYNNAMSFDHHFALLLSDHKFMSAVLHLPSAFEMVCGACGKRLLTEQTWPKSQNCCHCNVRFGLRHSVPHWQYQMMQILEIERLDTRVGEFVSQARRCNCAEVDVFLPEAAEAVFRQLTGGID